LAAAHYGLLSHGVLNAWFPVFNIELSRYSPGMILWVKLAQAAQERGIRRVDLGRGDQRYKTALMSGAVQVYQGSVATTTTGQLLRGAYVHVRSWARRSRIREPLRRMAQPLFNIHQKLTLR
jgi:CelD/BcsL family acetyltransferase involved in cellulose biosynthesis